MSPPNEDSKSFGPSVLEEELVSGTIIPLDQAKTLRKSLPTPDASQGDFYPFASRSPIRSSGGSKRRKSSSIIADDAFEDEWPGYRAHPTGLLVQEDMKPHYFPNKATKPCVASETKPRRGSLSPSESRTGSFATDHMSTSKSRTTHISELEASMTNLGISIPIWDDPFVVMATTVESKKSPFSETAPKGRPGDVVRRLEPPRQRGSSGAVRSPPSTSVTAAKSNEITSYFPPMESPQLALLDSRTATPRPCLSSSHFAAASSLESSDSPGPASWSSSRASDILDTPLSPPRFYQGAGNGEADASVFFPKPTKDFTVFADDLLTTWHRGSV